MGNETKRKEVSPKIGSLDEVNKECESIVRDLIVKLHTNPSEELSQQYIGITFAELHAVIRLAYRLFHSDYYEKIDQIKDAAIESISLHENKIK